MKEYNTRLAILLPLDFSRILLTTRSFFLLRPSFRRIVSISKETSLKGYIVIFSRRFHLSKIVAMQNRVNILKKRKLHT